MSIDYKIPTIAECNKLEKKFNVISTFSGGGGSCLGYKMAGGNVLLANEFIPEAQKTYRKNFPETILLEDDIRCLKGFEILQRVGLKKFELDLFDGSPPCSSFSTAGKREKGWGVEKKYSSTTQRVDDLFYEYIRLVDEIKPKVFIAENVTGLVTGNAKGYFKDIINCLETAGYNVKARLINALNYGVPQNRERLIIIGVRKDLGIEPSFPSIRVTPPFIGDAIKGYSCNLFRPINKGTETHKIYHKCNNHNKRAQFSRFNPRKTGYTRYRLSNNDYSCTINTRAEIFHPDIARTLSIRELKRVQSLPDDYTLTGSFGEQWERIGRMVAPLMMKAVAENIYEKVLKDV